MKHDVHMNGSECSSEDEARCRICYERDGILVRACNCAGTMEYIHTTCLAQWLRSSPAAVRRGCDVCGSAWRDDLVRKPRLWQFVKAMLFGERGEIVLRRFLRHVSNTKNVLDSSLHDIFDHVFNESDESDDENIEEDDDDSEEEVGIDEFVVPNDNHAAWDLDADGWEAIGLLAPAGGGVEELNVAAAAIFRIALWSIFFLFAMTQGRAALHLFAWGVRIMLTVDARVDHFILPGSLANYLEQVFPGLPCLQRAALFVRRHEKDPTRQNVTIWHTMIKFMTKANSTDKNIAPINTSMPKINLIFKQASQRLGSFVRQKLKPVNWLFFFTGRVAKETASPDCKKNIFSNVHLLSSVANRLVRLGRGPWGVDDIFVGFIALALDIRSLARLAKSRRGIFALSRHLDLAQYTLLALIRITLSPEAVAIDIATVFESLVSSPLAVVHCLCIFPSYVYAIRFTLAKLGLLSAEAHVLDLENGDGLAFHLTLLAIAASTTTVAAALLHSLHKEYLDWIAQHALTPLHSSS